MLHLGHRYTRRGLQAPFRQGDIHGRGNVPLIFELDRQRLKRRIEGHALDLFAGNGTTAQLQLDKSIARIPIVAGSCHRVAARDLHRHDRQGIVGLKLPGGAAATTKRPDTKGNHQHGKHRKTNRDKAMVRTAFLGRYIPLRLSI